MPSSSASAETAVLRAAVGAAAGLVGLAGLPPAAGDARTRSGEPAPAGEPPADDGGRSGSGSARQKQMTE